MNFPLENSGNLVVLIAGFFFGYFLEVSGLGSPRKLNAQFTLRDWSVFKVMFVAIVVAAAGLWLFDVLGWLRFDALKVPTPFFWAMAAGGALLGTGLAIGGYCPGTSLVGLFTGRIDALLFMLGMLIGDAFRRQLRCTARLLPGGARPPGPDARGTDRLADLADPVVAGGHRGRGLSPGRLV